MKKILFLASMLIVLNVSAQEKGQQRSGKGEKPTTEQRMKKFDDLNLTAAQKQKIEALYKERQASFEKNKGQKSGELKDGKSKKDMTSKHGDKKKGTKGDKKDFAQNKQKMDQNRKEFDSKIQGILTSEQYKKFQENRSKKMAAHSKKDGQKKEKKSSK